MDGVMLYLGKHGSHVNSLYLRHQKWWLHPRIITLRQLPSTLQISSLQLQGLNLQLQPGDGAEGVLGAAAAALAALTQLRLSCCGLLDMGTAEALAAALSQLPAGLEHLSISSPTFRGREVPFPTGVLERLQQLTYLELYNIRLQGPDRHSHALQPLQALTRLEDLRLDNVSADGQGFCVTAGVLSATHSLTRLGVSQCSVEPDGLSGKTLLQRLDLDSCTISGGAAGGVVRLLSHLQPLQQLTQLQLKDSLRGGEDGNLAWRLQFVDGSLQYVEQGSPPAAAYSALTASSRLQHLDINMCTLPAGAWQHMFPADRQLPHLTSCDISDVHQPAGEYFPALNGSCIVSCCPGLQRLDVEGLRCSAELLAPLRSLSGLRSLCVSADASTAAEGSTPADGLEALGQLTGLRGLSVSCGDNTMRHLLQMTQLRQLEQLTWLSFFNPILYGEFQRINLERKAPGDEPVWRQLLRRCLNHSDPDVAQQAAAALAE